MESVWRVREGGCTRMRDGGCMGSEGWRVYGE